MKTVYWELSTLSVILILLFSATTGYSHGVIGKAETRQAVCLNAAYDDGEPMSYAEVSIYSPKEHHPFQSGYTDSKGVFCFLPDTIGKWQLKVNDGMGHQLALGFDHRTKSTPSQPIAASPQLSKINGVIGGVGVIIGFGGLSAWWLSRKR